MDVNVIQFLHSGEEHGVDDRKKMIKYWNHGPHKRKFLKARGQYVTDVARGTLSEEMPLLFWGEWEPNSHVVEEFSPVKKLKLWPRYLHEPYLPSSKKSAVLSPVSTPTPCIGSCDETKKPKGGCITDWDNDCCQNTDPFVFGEAFIYSLCQQWREYKKGHLHTTYLSRLPIGSLILFGSKVMLDTGSIKEDAFALDTVFVVGDSRPYTIKNYKTDLAGFIPKDYGYIMGFDHARGAGVSMNIRCYKGATPANPVNGMYSFSPCQVAAPKGGKSFHKVLIKETDGLNDYINVKVQQGFKGSITIPDSEAQKVWTKVCEIVENQGCLQGVNFQY